jgi:aminomethyltransferase
MVDFAGWSMPVQYGSIVTEHQATRHAAGLFDISHMGRIRFDGPGSAAFLDSIVTRRVADMKPGQIRYALVTNDTGGILDDVLVYRIADAAGGAYHVLVVNASNREKILGWIEGHLPASRDFSHADLTRQWAMIAVQGPRAMEIVQPLVEGEIARLGYYRGFETRVGGCGGVVSRTGYTGEDGVELMVGGNAVVGLWETILANGQGVGAVAAGLGARDTLRLEAAMPLYGHELNEQITPWQAGLDFAVNLEGRSFPGRDQLEKMKQQPQKLRRVGLELDGKRVPRENYAVSAGGRPIGTVTSGTFSPTFERPIAMAYVDVGSAAPGTSVEVDLRGQPAPARVVELPFYRRPS